MEAELMGDALAVKKEVTEQLELSLNKVKEIKNNSEMETTNKRLRELHDENKSIRSVAPRTSSILSPGGCMIRNDVELGDSAGDIFEEDPDANLALMEQNATDALANLNTEDGSDEGSDYESEEEEVEEEEEEEEENVEGD
jgi:hypothetical protein